MKKTLTICLALMLIAVTWSQAQNRSNKVKVKPDQIKKMSTVVLEKDKKKFPKSYLYRMTKDSISLITPVKEVRGEPTIYCQKKLSLKDFDYLTVSNRKERLRLSVISGLIAGTLSYVITRNALRGDVADEPNLVLLGQRANSGRIEAAIMGVTGFGFGVLIGDLISDRKISLRRNQRAAVKQLKKYSYR